MNLWEDAESPTRSTAVVTFQGVLYTPQNPNFFPGPEQTFTHFYFSTKICEIKVNSIIPLLKKKKLTKMLTQNSWANKQPKLPINTKIWWVTGINSRVFPSLSSLNSRIFWPSYLNGRFFFPDASSYFDYLPIIHKEKMFWKV